MGYALGSAAHSSIRLLIPPLSSCTASLTTNMHLLPLKNILHTLAQNLCLHLPLLGLLSCISLLAPLGVVLPCKQVHVSVINE